MTARLLLRRLARIRSPSRRIALGRQALSEGDSKLLRAVLEEMLSHPGERRIRIAAETLAKLARPRPDPRARGLARRILGSAAYLRGDMKAAATQLRAAERLFENLGDRDQLARIRLAATEVASLLGRSDQARQCGRLALRGFAQLKDRRRAARARVNLGNLEYRLGRSAAARRHFRAAGRSFERLGDGVSLGVVQLNLANLEKSLDRRGPARRLYGLARANPALRRRPRERAHIDYGEAQLLAQEGAYRAALGMLESAGRWAGAAGETSLAAACDLDHSELLMRLNLTKEARRLAERSARGFRACGMGLELAQAQALAGAAAVIEGDGGIELLHSAKRSVRAIENKVVAADIEAWLAQALGAADRDAASRKAWERAMRGYRSQNLAAKAAQARVEIGFLQLRAGQPSAAQAQLRLADPILARSGVPAQRLRALHLRGKLAAAAGQVEAATRAFRAAERLIARLRLGLRAEQLKLSYLSDKQEFYEDAVAACLAGRSLRHQQLALEFAERSKSRALLELLDADLRAREEVPARHRSRWLELRRRLDGLYRRLHQQELLGKRRDLELDQRLVARIRRLEDQLDRLRGEAARSRARVPVVAELQRRLDREEILIEYFGWGDSLIVFVVTRSEFRILTLPAALERARELELALRFQMQKFQYNSGYVERHEAALRATCERLLSDLHSLLIAPLGSLNGRRLLFVLHGPLHYLPIPALLGPEGYLWDRYEIAVGPSAALLLEPSRRAPAAGPPLVVGADDGTLPFVREEALAVAAMAPRARLLIGPEARPAEFLRLAPDSQWIHIAAHGIYRDDNPLFSAMALSDGWLTYHDLLGLPLNAELVVLSGCDTGRHRIDAGDEALGFARGFLRAGVANLVVSLWAVHDRTTAELMRHFHARWHAGLSVPAALREAALEVRQQHPHPYFWAPFVAVGRPRGGQE